MGCRKLTYWSKNEGLRKSTTPLKLGVDYYPFGLSFNQQTREGTQGQNYGFQGQEHQKDLDLGWVQFKWRMHNPSIGRFFNVDPLASDYVYNSPYAFSENSPIAFVELEGLEKVLAIYFHGGPSGGGYPSTVGKAGTTGDFYTSTQKATSRSGREFSGIIIAPGATSASGVKTGLDYAKENYEAGDQVIIYGYSYGVDVAVDLTEQLKETGIAVDLLVTVDGSDGPLQNTTVNKDIPDNVDTNLNIYQTDDSGKSGSSRSTGVSSSGTSSGSSTRDSGTSNSPGSNGSPNAAVNPSKTTVINRNVTASGTTHGNIQQKNKNTIQNQINTNIQIYPRKK